MVKEIKRDDEPSTFARNVGLHIEKEDGLNSVRNSVPSIIPAR